MVKNKRARQSNLELLRIVAMFMIICCHFVTYNNFGPTDVFSEKVLGLSILRMGGKLGVVLFVMITGYFMLNKAFRWQRVIDLSKQTMYFSIIVVLLTYAFQGTLPDLLGITRIIFPLIMANYWFPTDFALILILSPLLNKVMNDLDERIVRVGLIGSVCMIGLPIIMPDMKNQLISLIVSYCMGAYVRKYDIKIDKIKIFMLIGAILVATSFVTGALLAAAKSNAFFSGLRLFFVSGFNVGAFIIAFLIFVLFKDWEFGSVPVINLIASTTFGVYLFHDSRSFRIYMWNEIVNPTRWHGLELVGGLIVSALGIFVTGMILDLIRQYIGKVFAMLKSKFFTKNKMVNE